MKKPNQTPQSDFDKALSIKVNEAYRSYIEKERYLESLIKEALKESKAKEIVWNPKKNLNSLGF